MSFTKTQIKALVSLSTAVVIKCRNMEYRKGYENNPCFLYTVHKDFKFPDKVFNGYPRGFPKGVKVSTEGDIVTRKAIGQRVLDYCNLMGWCEDDSKAVVEKTKQQLMLLKRFEKVMDNYGQGIMEVL